MKKTVLVLAALTVAAGGMFSGCANLIDAGPSYEVSYATGRVSPAVVQLDVLSEDFSDGQAHPSRGLGSGVIIDAEGHVLTNFHVAGRAQRIEITLANEEHVKATLVGSDHWTDLALVKLDTDDLKRRHLTFEFASLGDSSKVLLGQPAMALGTPHGLKRTLTHGIISNTDRYFAESSVGEYETGWFNNWLQTDAAINPGNSGGPLLNLKGEVIGINTRASLNSNNLGFAIPINVAKEIIPALLKDHKVSRSYLGIRFQPLQDLEHYYDLHNNNGVLIGYVESNSPAAKVIQPQDILLAVNDQPVTARFPEQLAAVRKLIADQLIGSDVKLTIRRSIKGAGQISTVTLKTEKLESVVTEEKSIGEWGLSARELTRAYVRENRLPANTEGVLVTGVREASPGADARLYRDDIIIRVDNKPIQSIADLDAAVQAWKKNPKLISVDVRRDRNEERLVLKPRQ